MPKNEVTDPIISQEIDFAHPVLADPHPFNVSRGQILNRLWEIGNINPEITRGSLVGQVKALAMVVAIEGLIPDRRGASAQTKPAPPPVEVDIYQSEWLRNQRSGKNENPEPAPPKEETASGPSSVPDDAPSTAEPIPTPASAVTPTPELAPRVPMADHFAPDTRVPFHIQNNRFGRRR